MKTIRHGLAALTLLTVLFAAGEIFAQDNSDSSGVYRPGPAHTPFTTEQATTPETIAFMYMQRLAASSLISAEELRDQLQKYRGQSHDRMRKALEGWIGPDEFKRRREVYQLLLKEAQDALSGKTARTGTTPRTSYGPPTDADRRKNETLATAKLRQAAQSWPDPLLREFLMGLADLQANTKATVENADTLFRECRKKAPRIAAFHQARATVLMKLNRPLDALDECVQTLRLAPDSKQALDRIAEVMQKVPSAEMRRAQYIQAQDVLKEYKDGGGSSGAYGASNATITWLMPGKQWTTGRAFSLPLPPYDRLVFRQAVAVPIGKNMLLVDADGLKGALEISVRIDPKTVAVAKVKTISGVKNAPPLALLTVPGYEFTPLEGGKTTAFEVPMTANVYALSAYEEMGATVREIRARIKAVDTTGAMKFDDKLCAGEAASPMIADDGRLVGFLAGKTDVTAEDGGPNRFYPLRDILPLIEQASKSGSSGYSRSTATPKSAAGKYFIVHVLSGELFDR